MKHISLSNKIWKKKGEFSKENSLFENFCRIQNKLVCDFAYPKFSDLSSPFLFRDAKKTIDIIFSAIEKKERIMIFGDYDLDGMSGTAQIFLTLKTLGASVSYRLPSRQDGYGLSEKFVLQAHKNDVKIFITTDCGISNYNEVFLAKQLGIKFIITDHHSVPENIPPADAIWHPLLSIENFPDKNLTGAGVAWYFCSALLRTRFPKNSQQIEKELLELAVLGTVADCGALQGENRKITLLGLENLKKTKNSGLKELMNISRTSQEDLTAESIGFFLGPRLNASGRLAHPQMSLELLLGNSSRAKELEQLNTKRQKLVSTFLEEAEDQLLQTKTKDLPATIVSSKNWMSGVIGLISGKLTEKYGKPTIAFSIEEKKITGSCRGPQDFNIVATLRAIHKKNPEYFLGFGGHSQAAGLSIYPKYFQDFCLKFHNEVKKIRGEKPPLPFIEYHSSISRKISIEEVEELKQGEPFGVGNPSPLFKFSNLEVIKIKAIGKDQQHLSLFVKSPYSEIFSCIFFQAGAIKEKIFVGEKIEVLALPKINKWNDTKNISLHIQDIRK